MVESVGHVVWQEGAWVVRCAMCGKGVRSVAGGTRSKKKVEESLREAGWNNRGGGLWRHWECEAKHKEVEK